MSNNCNITAALEGINRLRSLVKDINASNNVSELTASSLDNMINNVLGSRAAELKGYKYIAQARSKELNKLKEDIDNLSSESPLFTIISKRRADKDVDSATYYRTLNRNEGIDVKSVITIAEPTVVNSVDLNGVMPSNTVRLLEQTSQALESALQNVSSGSKGNITASDRKHNPAFNFLSTVNNSPNMLAALRSAVDNYILENYTDLTAPKDPLDVAEMLNLNLTDNDSDKALMAVFRNGGSLASIEARKLGQSIASTLGIKAAKESNIDDYNALLSGFGQVGLMLMSELGYIKPYRVPERSNSKVPLTREELDGTGKFIKTLDTGQNVVDTGVFVSDDLSIDRLDDIKKAVDPLNKFIEAETEAVLPSFERPTTNYSNLGKRRQEFVKVTRPAAKAVEHLENIEYSVESSPLDKMLKAFGLVDDVNSINADSIDVIIDSLLSDTAFRKSVGITDLKDADGNDIPYSKSRRESIVAVNKSIKISYVAYF